MTKIDNSSKDDKVKPYRGRFAPSPTGPLHFGSLLAAAASYVDAKANGGKWLLRIDDLDINRNRQGADTLICNELQRLGMHWDEQIYYQTDYTQCHRDALNELEQHTYPCSCSRKNLVNGRYPGTCRQGLKQHRKARSIRLKVPTQPITFVDLIRGETEQCLCSEVGDFVLLRADNIISYHLATVIDDVNQNITHIVRGADLLFSTPRQIYLQQLLSLPMIKYAHIDVVVDKQKVKLSKQTGALAINKHPANKLIVNALILLGQKPPTDLHQENVEDIWHWAICHWRLPSNNGENHISAPEFTLKKSS